MYASMARWSASARPSDGSDFMMSKVDAMSHIAAFDSTAQCETSSAAQAIPLQWKPITEAKFVGTESRSSTNH